MRMIIKLSIDEFDEIMDLFVSSFIDDDFYVKLYPDKNMRLNALRSEFASDVKMLLNSGFSYGYLIDDAIVGFILCFEYFHLLNTDKPAFDHLFGLNVLSEEKQMLYDMKLHNIVRQMQSNVIFEVSVAVKPDYQRQHIATTLVEHVLKQYSDYHLVSDVSNEKSLSLYENLGGSILKIEDGYWLVIC